VAVGYAIERGGEGFVVREHGYVHQLLDVDEREILAYHWHPTGVSPVTWPHLRLSGRLPPLDVGRGQASISLGGKHLTTGPINLSDFVRLLITEFDVQPRRADWAAVLESNREPFSSDG